MQAKGRQNAKPGQIKRKASRRKANERQTVRPKAMKRLTPVVSLDFAQAVSAKSTIAMRLILFATPESKPL